MKFPNSQAFRQTKIVCTLGPACQTAAEIGALLQAGMNVARINVSHGNRASHRELLQNIAAASTAVSLPVASLFDTRGAEIRTGDVQTPILVTAGQQVLFVPASQETTATAAVPIIAVGYDGFAKDVQEASSILVDNGELRFCIDAIQENGQVLATAEQSGSIGSRRHINLPGANIDLPSITDKDWDDIKFAADYGVDFIALSFIRTAEEVSEVRTLINKKKSALQIVTKIETQQAVKNIVEIIAASDAIMIARGDLGAEIPFEHLPVVQAEIISRCRDAGKPVIVATHMLESMREHPIPTRAEVTDVAHAAVQKADATMLSGETAGGKHPVIAVQSMDKILRATETQEAKFPLGEASIHTTIEEQVETTLQKAKAGAVQAIVVDGNIMHAKILSKLRPEVPIFLLTKTSSECTAMLLFYGVIPILIPEDRTKLTVIEQLESSHSAAFLLKGDRVSVWKDGESEISTL